MNIRYLLIFFLIVGSACQSGLIPCPVIKADKTRRSSSFVKKIRPKDKNTTASAREIPASMMQRPVRSTTETDWRVPEVRPALENIDVEEWDCPKPGSKRTMPKALKENIKKNKKAYEYFYRHKADSSQALRNLTGE